MRRKLALIAILLTAVTAVPAIPVKGQKDAPKVFMTPKGHSYHRSQHCSTLNHSKHVIEVTLEKAKSLGLKPCKVCKP